MKYHLWNNFCMDSQWEIQREAQRGRVKALCHIEDDEVWSTGRVVNNLQTSEIPFTVGAGVS